MRRLVTLTPIVFVLHFLEEGTKFVEWFNAHVPRGITNDLFWTVNFVALAITLVVVIVAWVQPGAGADSAAAGWFSFLFGANAILHIVGAVHDRAYVPGLITAIALYVPLYILIMRRIVGARRVGVGALTGIALVCAAPMLIHAYLIIFRGSRLF